MYTYKIKDVRVIDGDSLEGTVDLGFNITVKLKFRLFGIDTPEISGVERPEGLAAKEFTKNYFSKQTEFKIVVSGKDKYGRYLASVFDNTNLCLNETLVEHGLAIKYFGGAK